MKSVVASCLVVSMAIAPWSQVLAQEPEDKDLLAGIQQVEQGDFEVAITTLEAVVRKLAAKGGRSRSLGRAYTYLAIAYLGLAQEAQARTKVIEAWRADPKMTLSRSEFPPRVIQLFEDTLKAEGITPPPPPPEPKVQKPPEKGGSKALFVLLGVGAAAGVGVVVASSGGGSDNPASTPSPSFPEVAGTWVGTGSNGFFFTGGPCTQQNEVTLRLSQSGGSLTGTISDVVARVGGPEGCLPPSAIGRGETVSITGAVRTDNSIEIVRSASAASPSFTLRGTVQANRMNGDFAPPVNGTWVLLRQ